MFNTEKEFFDYIKPKVEFNDGDDENLKGVASVAKNLSHGNTALFRREARILVLDKDAERFEDGFEVNDAIEAVLGWLSIGFVVYERPEGFCVATARWAINTGHFEEAESAFVFEDSVSACAYVCKLIKCVFEE